MTFVVMVTADWSSWSRIQSERLEAAQLVHTVAKTGL